MKQIKRDGNTYTHNPVTNTYQNDENPKDFISMSLAASILAERGEEPLVEEVVVETPKPVTKTKK